MQTEHETYMRRCLQLAAGAKATGHTAVGSLLLRDGEIVAEGGEGDGRLPGLLAHAEVVAIVEACRKLQTQNLEGCVLYTTVEPCFMCSYLIRVTRISGVVYGAPTNGTGGVLSAYPLLSADDIDPWSHTPSIRGGVLHDACLKMLHAG